MTYFKFLKWLLKLNFYTMMITFCVITVPYLALGPSTYEDTVKHLNNSDISITCTQEYIQYMDNFTAAESLDEKVIDFLQGTVSHWLYNVYLIIRAGCEKGKQFVGTRNLHQQSKSLIIEQVFIYVS